MTFWQVARRPQWIALLVLALALAALFAWLGKWQIERAVIQSNQNQDTSEAVVSLTSLTRPGEPVTETVAAKLVTTEAMLDPSTVMVLPHRLNFGTDGYWVIGRLSVLVDNEPASLAAGLGWAPTETEAQSVVDALKTGVSIQAFVPTSGRYMPSQEPEAPAEGTDPHVLTSMSVAALANIWPDPTTPYFTGYLVVDSPPEGLDAIESIPVMTDASLNWLNVFYAIEWVVFAGFAVFLWYRLVRDARQRELDVQADAEAGA